MRIVQLSDSHISRDHPARTGDLAACIRHINALDHQPDVVAHTGDISHDGHAEEYATARRLLDQLTAPYVVLAGNRDNRHELIKAFADGQHLRLGMEFVQYAVERFATRLIVADTMTTTSNKGRLCPARLADIERLLAADSSRPAALFLHHPPFEVHAAPDPIHFEDWADVEALKPILARNRQICGVFCGHVHRSVEGVVGEVRASTVSCVAVDLRKGVPRATAADPPMFQIHTVP